MITAVFLAWAAVVLFLLGLPLVAWWVGGRRFWSRTVAAEVDQLRRAVAAEHGLRPLDMPRVESAATWGRAPDTPQLRAATVDWARGAMAINERRRAARPRLRAAVLLVLALWLTLVVSRVVLTLVHQRWGQVNWFSLVWWAFLGGSFWQVHTGPKRAVRLNSDPVRP